MLLLIVSSCESSLIGTSPGQTSRNCRESTPSSHTLLRRSLEWRAIENPYDWQMDSIQSGKDTQDMSTQSFNTLTPGKPPSVPGTACSVVLMRTDDRETRAIAR